MEQTPELSGEEARARGEDAGGWPLRIVQELPSLSPQEALKHQGVHLDCSIAVSLHWSSLRRNLRALGIRARERCGWLEVDASDLDQRDVATNIALAHGYSVVDVEGPELVQRVRLDDAERITSALRAIRQSENGYLILEADAPSEAYVQLMLEGSEKRIEAAAGRGVVASLGRSSARLQRLRLLGFTKGTDAHPNYTRTLESDEPDTLFTHLAQRALVDVYGLDAHTTLRLRTFEDV